MINILYPGSFFLRLNDVMRQCFVMTSLLYDVMRQCFVMTSYLTAVQLLFSKELNLQNIDIFIDIKLPLSEALFEQNNLNEPVNSMNRIVINLSTRPNITELLSIYQLDPI